MTSSFPEPRLDIDDGNQATADMHAREDLLLELLQRYPRGEWVDSDSDLSRNGVSSRNVVFRSIAQAAQRLSSRWQEMRSQWSWLH